MSPDLVHAALDAIPSFILVVDEDVRILHANAAARRLLGSAADLESVRLRRAGHPLHCVHSNDVAEGCGRGPHCRTCVVRGAVGTCLREGRVVREKTIFEQVGHHEPGDTWFMVTAAPFEHQGARVALLTLEDISELMVLRGIVPICSWCRRVRTGDNYWQTVERYVSAKLAVDWTHSICDECLEKQAEPTAEEGSTRKP
jgi:PAS domain-containing protein